MSRNLSLTLGLTFYFVDYSARIEKANREEQRRERANPVLSGLASRRVSDTQITFSRDRAEHFHSFQGEPAHHPETWMTPELADSGLEDAFKRLRRPTPERSSIVGRGQKRSILM